MENITRAAFDVQYGLFKVDMFLPPFLCFLCAYTFINFSLLAKQKGNVNPMICISGEGLRTNNWDPPNCFCYFFSITISCSFMVTATNIAIIEESFGWLTIGTHLFKMSTKRLLSCLDEIWSQVLCSHLKFGGGGIVFILGELLDWWQDLAFLDS